MIKKVKSKTWSSYFRPLRGLGIAAVIALIVMIVALVYPKTAKGEFTPPPFDEGAVAGTPEVPEELGYSELYQNGMAYHFSVCGRIYLTGTEATVYLTNPSDNETWLKIRILDKDGNILGESGIVRPGEYVKDVTLSKALPANTPIALRIMGYVPDTYHSAGVVTLNTTTRGTMS